MNPTLHRMHSPHNELVLSMARSAIDPDGSQTPPNIESAPWLYATQACFVTLWENKKLRGQYGNVRADRPLIEHLQHNARQAAFHDPRFKPINAEQLLSLQIQVSLLSALTAIDCTTEKQVLDQLTPGTDGVFFRYGQHASNFLPTQWEVHPDPSLFIAYLKQKAGLPPNFWLPGIEIHTYTVKDYLD